MKSPIESARDCLESLLREEAPVVTWKVTIPDEADGKGLYFLAVNGSIQLHSGGVFWARTSVHMEQWQKVQRDALVDHTVRTIGHELGMALVSR